MLIKQIILNNFRVYCGPRTLKFSADKKKNITIIAGNNGFGKTSFLTALVWCLYGKSMVDVDERYREDIKESGGYKKYCSKLMNRHAINSTIDIVSQLTRELEEKNAAERELIQAKINELTSFSVAITFSRIMVPSVLCNRVEIIRTYNQLNDKETIEVLIDGKSSELTRNIGSEIFINDFILPKEIAKFFLFDAEKIVSLAEINTIDEKRYLSQSYAEVLGIKKYTDLKDSLEQMRYRIREKSATKSDRNSLDKLNVQLGHARKLVLHKNDQLDELTEAIFQKKLIADKYQEKLIREGSTITLDELRRLKEQRANLTTDLSKVRARFNDMLELAPFAILGSKIALIKKQLEHENSNNAIAESLLKTKLETIKTKIEQHEDFLGISPTQKKEILKLIKSSLLPKQDGNARMLLNFTPDQQNNFFIIFEKLRSSYSKSFKILVTEQKRLQSQFNNVNRKMLNAESKSLDPVISDIRKSKEKIDEEAKSLEHERAILVAERDGLELEIKTCSRQISELSKKVELEDVDKAKDQTAERMINKLDLFINKLKHKKKGILEHNILKELNRLMHKSDFVNRVNVIIEGDLIDIELYDGRDQYIDKELLSKGEQQLYATALLKALVEESNIRFPVFIDSPLQKFDKGHSQNIIKEFYPNLSSQVILFPLLHKELTKDEYSWMVNTVGRAYLIQQDTDYNSEFIEVNPKSLFEHYKQVQEYAG